MKKAIIVLGTRPEAIKLLPVYIELKKASDIETILVSTGQHKEMLLPILDFFKVRPDHSFDIMTDNQNLETLTSQILLKCASLFRVENPDLVLVQGDTTTAMATALSAFYQRIPIGHIEAGLRSYELYSPFPEEVNRKVISQIASLHFTPTDLGLQVIRKENTFGKVYKVGNTVIDSLYFAVNKNAVRRKYFESHYAAMINGFERMILITAHRRENFGAGFIDVCNGILKLATSFPKNSWIYPVHLNPNVRQIVYDRLGNIPNIFLIDPVSYDHMVFLMTRSYFIITDSGGIQEEAPALGKPVIVMRKTTERPEGIASGNSILVGTSETKIVRTATKLLTDKKFYQAMSKTKNPYGKGDSAKKIVRSIHTFFRTNRNK